MRVYVRLYVRELVRFVRWRRFDQFSSDRTKSVGELHSERFKLGGHSHCVTLTSLNYSTIPGRGHFLSILHGCLFPRSEKKPYRTFHV